jgi:hypothetical protein
VGNLLSLILSFIFPERLHCCYIYSHCSYRVQLLYGSRTFSAWVLIIWLFLVFFEIFKKDTNLFYVENLEYSLKGSRVHTNALFSLNLLYLCLLIQHYCAEPENIYLKHVPGLKKLGDFTVSEGHGYPLVYI